MAGAEPSAPAIADFAAPGVTGFNVTGQGNDVAVEPGLEKTRPGPSPGPSPDPASRRLPLTSPVCPAPKNLPPACRRSLAPIA